eukprot:1195663-Prorocentrum_minimum.AAC.14
MFDPVGCVGVPSRQRFCRCDCDCDWFVLRCPLTSEGLPGSACAGAVDRERRQLEIGAGGGPADGVLCA